MAEVIFEKAKRVTSNLTISLGGVTENTNLFTYNGSSSKTVNINPTIIGASSASHVHSANTITQDSTHKFVTDVDKNSWNLKGKTAKYFAAQNFYVPQNDTYNGLNIAQKAWDDIGVTFQGDLTTWKHVFIVPTGAYILKIGIMINTGFNTQIETALKINVDDVETYNPWFRLFNNYHTIEYVCIFKGSKVQPLIYSGLECEILGSQSHTYYAFARLS